MSYLEERLCLAARLLNGDENTAVDSEITDALSALIDTLMPSETREYVDAASVVELLCACVKWHDHVPGYCRVRDDGTRGGGSIHDEFAEVLFQPSFIWHRGLQIPQHFFPEPHEA